MQMHKIPDEILLRIFNVLVDDVQSLIRVSQVSKRFNRLIDDPKLWYNAFLSRYPVWGSRVEYSFNSKRLIDWKDFMIHLVKQQKATENFSFEFVQEQLLVSRRKRRFEEDTIEEPVDQEDEDEDEDEDEEEQLPFWIQDPLVVDIDRIDKTGIVATGKHRKDTLSRTSQHKILFWEYPSWKLIRTFELNLTPSNITCQIIGIQSIRMPTADGKGIQKARFFTLAVGIAFMNGLDQQQPPNQEEFEDRVDIWKAIFVYRLFDDGSTQCVAHVRVEDLFLGREVFLFSDTSWCQSNDGDCNDAPQDASTSPLADWMKIICPSAQATPPSSHVNSRFTVYMLAIGPIFERNITGCVQLAQFDIRGQRNILDPSTTPVVWDTDSNQLVAISKKFHSYLGFGHPINHGRYLFESATDMLTCIRLGTDVSCMIHFKYPPHLNHLICTGSYQDDELSVYDWRFGIKVGSLPWKTTEDATVIRRTTSIVGANPAAADQLDHAVLPPLHLNRRPGNEDLQEQQQQQQGDGEEEEDADTVEVPVDVRPWGLESTLVLPPHWMSSDGKKDAHEEYNREDLAQHGFRLIAVGDNRSDNQRDKLEIKVWDISYLLQVQWDPLIESYNEAEENISDSLMMELTQRFTWWPRRTKELSRLAIQMILEQQYQSHLLSQHDFSIDLTHHHHQNLQHNTHHIQHSLYTNNKKNHPQQFMLPYSPPQGLQSMLLSHTFDKDEQQQQQRQQPSEDIPVKYTAYNVLYTSLFLLTEDGKVTVMDIETGKITGTVENVAQQQVEGKRSSSLQQESSQTTTATQQVRGIDVNVIGGREVVVTSKEGLLRGIVS
ncbi:uncharacterized protein ATC70_009773 [Mucor velutinosus]|uniref:F-box domain-containing protein n=1 Tax=Mucor velutinosus TaxID=708070 RepID=A0AAN7DM62_9FUNG|nr:hypothetical protein ATC70_009773 [Mucor velutinosus]